MTRMIRAGMRNWSGAALAALTLVACGGNSDNNGTTSPNDAGITGGSSATGGSKSVGGSSSKAGGSSTGGTTANTTRGGASSQGGSSAVGGTVAGGNTAVAGNSATGGNQSVGGASANVGGSSTTGGAPSVGGITGAGGTSMQSQGGSSSVGGSTASSGGTTSTSTNNGGASATGGVVAVGGSSAAGGISGTGGSSSVGGVATMGGATAAAGASATGGVISTGGATTTAAGAPSTGGSSGTCGADGAACTLTGGVLGLCQNNVCTACTGGTQGNTACSVAYGAGTGYVCASGACVPGDCVTTADCAGGTICGLTAPNVCGACANDGQCRAAGAYGSGYLCVSGSCVPGNCKVDTDCSTGQICGLQIPYACAGCTTDVQCQNDPTYGATTICNTTSSTCVASACTTNNATCTANASDFCCASACTPGNCCVTADCASLGNNYTCTNHTCTRCAQATGNTYFVDPVNGSDSVGTGANSAGCTFKTITRAIAFIGATPNSGTLINVLSTGVVSTASGEAFPIQVPTNTTVSGSGGTVTVQVPAAKVGFVLSKASSGLTMLTIDGQTNTATNGIAITGGSAMLSNLSVSNMLHDGIHVTNSATVSLGAGVSSSQNGTTTTGADGLHISNSSLVTINVTSGTATHFDKNSAHGILVDGTASIALTGTPGTNGAGTVTTNGNTLAGVWIEQTPGGTLPQNTISGLVSWANQGNGIRIVAGSAVQLRNSVVLANAGNGVLVSTNTTATPPSDDTSKIDLGKASGPSYGQNTLQASLGSNPNNGAGICLQVSRTAGSVLNAAGNVFAGPVDCSSSTSTLTRNNTCSGRVDVSINATGTTTNSIVVSLCN